MTSIFSVCKYQWNTHHEIPMCTRSVQWLKILPDGNICYRTHACASKQAVNTEAKGCIQPEDACPKWNKLELDQLDCQTDELSTDGSLLELPGTQ
ncbi:unnamed protein product, partial [Allacma fusca]